MIPWSHRDVGGFALQEDVERLRQFAHKLPSSIVRNKQNTHQIRSDKYHAFTHSFRSLPRHHRPACGNVKSGASPWGTYSVASHVSPVSGRNSTGRIRRESHTCTFLRLDLVHVASANERRMMKTDVYRPLRRRRNAGDVRTTVSSVSCPGSRHGHLAAAPLRAIVCPYCEVKHKRNVSCEKEYSFCPS